MRLLIITLLSFLALNAHAASHCNFDKMQFGTTVEQVLSYYELEVLEVVKEGEFIVAEEGKVVCDALPERVRVEFSFIDDTFVKTTIQGLDESGALLTYATKIFGESDDADRKKAAGDKTLLALWAKDARQSVIYSVTKNTRNESRESLTITSKLHSKLFEKISVQRGKAIDDYLKVHGLGKYGKSDGVTAPVSQSKSQPKKDKGASGSNSGSGAYTGDYDANAVDELKRKYERSQDAWKKKNDADKQGR